MSQAQTPSPLPSRSQVHHSAPPTPWYKKPWVWVVAVLVVVAVVVAIVFATRGEVETPQSEPQSEPVDIVVEEEDVTEPPTEPEDNEAEDDQEAAAQCEAALISATDYAETLYMSEAGIRALLTSPDGDGFSEPAAQCALDKLNWDWNANALEKAKMYAQDPDMTREDIYEQLVGEYGERFTPEQAEAALEQLDLS